MADWQPGDLALCVRAGAFRCSSRQLHTGKSRDTPRRGFVGKVIATTIPPLNDGSDCKCGCVLLIFEGGEKGVSPRFVKVTPPKADEFDKEVISLMTTNPSKVEA